LLALAVANGKRSGDHHFMSTAIMAFKIDDTMDRCFHPVQRVIGATTQDESIIKLKFSPNSELLGASSHGSATFWNVAKQVKVAEYVVSEPQTGDAFRFSTESRHKPSFVEYLRVNFDDQRYKLRNRRLLVQDFALANDAVAVLTNNRLRVYQLTHVAGRYDRLMPFGSDLPAFKSAKRIAFCSDGKTILAGDDKAIFLLK